MRLEEFLEQNAGRKMFARGELMIEQGAQAEAAYCIISGRAQVFRHTDDGEAVLAVLGAGEVVGEMALLRFDHYTLSVRALEDTEAYVITPGLMHEELRKTHPLIRLVLDSLLERMKEVNQTLIDLEQVG